MAFQPCPHCSFEWTVNPTGLELDIAATRATQVLNLHCPMCGTAQGPRTSLSDLGAILTRDGNVCQWDTLQGRSTWIAIQGARQIKAADIFFSAVPVFKSGSGKVTVGQLPVKPEFLQLVDLPAFRANPGLWGRIDPGTQQYTATVPLHGLGAQTIHLPLVGRGGIITSRPEQDAMSEVSLTVWPNVTSAVWRVFAVEARFGTDADWLAALSTAPVKVLKQSGAGLIDLLPAPATGLTPTDGNAATHRPRRFAELVDGGRPSAIAIDALNASGQRYGAVFLPAEQRPAQPGHQTIKMGLDFGTSNSCVAFETASGPTVLPIRDLNEYLVQWHASGLNVPARDWAPRFPTRVFGPGSDILPSELLLAAPLNAVMGLQEAQIKRLRPGIDFCIPGNDVEWKGWTSAGATISDLKWSENTLTTGFTTPALKSAFLILYLRALLVSELAAWLSSHADLGDPAQINLDFGYPGMWTTTEVTSFKSALQGAFATAGAGQGGEENPEFDVRRFVNVGAQLGDGKSEAFAAASVTIQAGVVGDVNPYRAQLLVDVGGGSSDVCLAWQPNGMGMPVILETMFSLRYAGNDVFVALAPAGDNRHRCFRLDLADSEVEREIRAHGVTNELFNQAMQSARNARIEVFFGQLLELLARTIAATALNGAWERRGAARGPMRVDFARLGNGWGMARLVHPSIDSTFPQLLNVRIAQLLQGAGPTPQVYPSMLDGIHPKHAVALGLLTGNQIARARYSTTADVRDDSTPGLSIDGAPTPWTTREIVGMPVEMIPFTGEPKVLEWWRPVQNDAIHYPLAHGTTRLETQATYRWNPASLPPDALTFPPNIVRNDPSAFDQSILQSAAHLNQAVTGTYGGWFNHSPLRLLLQRGLRDRLKTLTH